MTVPQTPVANLPEFEITATPLSQWWVIAVFAIVLFILFNL